MLGDWLRRRQNKQRHQPTAPPQQRRQPDVWAVRRVLKAAVYVFRGDVKIHELVPHTIILRYKVSDPYAVYVTIEDDNTWVIDRSIIANAPATRSWIGEGDVASRTCDCEDSSHVLIQFTREENMVLINTHRADVIAFCAAMYGAVPDGDECVHYDLDGELQKLLS